jgi:tetratricopeptide (TPR) repeat protein
MRRQLFLMCVLLSLLNLVVYWQTPTFEFVDFDDPLYITENEHVQTGLTSKGVIWAFTSTKASNWHPLTWLSHMLDCELYGVNPRGHHLTNLLLHLANTVLLFLVLAWMTEALWRSFFVASLFALHPLHVESVAWIAERKDVLSSLFWMLTLWAYTRYVQRNSPKRYLLALFFFALGLMSKPMLVTLPFVLLLLDYWPLGRCYSNQWAHTGDLHVSVLQTRPGQRSLALRLVLEKTPFLALAAISSLATFLIQQTSGATKSLEHYALTDRLANALVSYVKYIGKMIWPQKLAVFYPHPGSSLTFWQVGGAFLLLVLVSILVVRAAKHRPYLLVGWCWYLGTSVPVIGLVQVGEQAMADRYTYLPLNGLFIMIAWGVPELLARYRFKRIVLSLAATGLLVSLMLVSCLQVSYWRNSVLLYEHALAVTENNYLAHNNLGTVLEEIGNLEEATVHYAEAVRIKPDYALAHNNLGEIKARQGMAKEAMSHYYLALKNKPDYAKPYNNLGIELAKQVKLQEAVFYLSQALEIEPSYADAHCNLGAVLARQGKIEEAMTHFSEALRIDPGFARAYNNLGETFIRRGELHKAAFHFSQALEIEPSYAEAHSNLGAVLARQGKIEEAMTHFSEALRINPSSVEALNNMGVTLARRGKFQESIGYFSRALKLEPDNVGTRENMNRVLKKEARGDVANE